MLIADVTLAPDVSRQEGLIRESENRIPFRADERPAGSKDDSTPR